MKKNLLIAMIMATNMILGIVMAKDYSASASYEWGTFSEEKINYVIQIQHLNEDMMKKIMEGERQDIAIECTSGTSIPVFPFLKGGLINLEPVNYNAFSINVLKTLYLKSNGKEILFSHNLTEWKSFFEFITGNATVSLEVKEGQVSACIGAELNARQ